MYGPSSMLPFLDFLFIIACLTFGFGLSLATYRFFALRYDWPMGEVHARKPWLAILIGMFTIAVSILFASARQYEASRAEISHYDGFWIVFWGIGISLFLTSVMRVGSQISLLLAPLAVIILMTTWISVRTPPGYITTSGLFVPFTYVPRAPLPERSPHHISNKVLFAQDFKPAPGDQEP